MAVGFATGLSLAAKHTAVLLPLVYAAVWIASRLFARPATHDGVGTRAKTALLGLVLACGVLAAVYSFSWDSHYFASVRNTLIYQERGQQSFCPGKVSSDGFWYYFLVCLALKTPLPLLIMIGLAVFYAKQLMVSLR